MIVLSHHPHIRNRVPSGRVALATALVWLPLLAAACALWPRSFPPVLAAAAAAAIAVPLLAGRGRVSAPVVGWALADAALLALLLPAAIPWHVPALLLAVVAAARLLLADRDFQPPVNLVAVALAVPLLLTDPSALTFKYGGTEFTNWINIGNFYFLSGIGPLAVTALLIPLLLGRWFKWPSLLSFLAGTAAAVAVAGRLAGHGFDRWWLELLLCTAMVSGIGLVAEQRSSPLSRRSQAWAGAFAGVLFALFALRGLCYQGMVIAPLCANLLTPLLDYLAGGRAATKLSPRGGTIMTNNTTDIKP